MGKALNGLPNVIDGAVRSCDGRDAYAVCTVSVACTNA